MPMLIVTTDDVPGREIAETLGLASGWGSGTPYSRSKGNYHLHSRDAALAEEAEEMGADAIVALRIAVSDDVGGGCNFFACGTAVKLQ